MTNRLTTEAAVNNMVRDTLWCPNSSSLSNEGKWGSRSGATEAERILVDLQVWIYKGCFLIWRTEQQPGKGVIIYTMLQNKINPAAIDYIGHLKSIISKFKKALMKSQNLIHPHRC